MKYEREVFVFGSNLKGIHGAGAAKYAHEHHGAKWGKGAGMTGDSFALPTVYVPGKPIRDDQMEAVIGRFVLFAFQHPTWKFRLTKVGCGLAGFPEEFIACRFVGASDNVVLIDDDGKDVMPARLWYQSLFKKEAA